ncbi:conserved hypothetical protein [Treponema primitia ZAS-2]|uniref:Lipoprotein n=1 Tax=Treponema primitia (strain ATCC BAA-887 / DSM 12427 / ZAS-2) TaxID=545694 RepID=F5YKD8_TREPZ|nr:hypothetical protein [Treponema primitia]AEF86471.1 conserved hypothetical protein [Treponema primitia ZAS-2]
MMKHLSLVLALSLLLLSGALYAQDNGNADEGFEYDWSNFSEETEGQGDTEGQAAEGYTQDEEYLNYLDVEETAAEEPSVYAELPRSFRHIFLGIGLDGLKIVLREDDIFRFREDRDVSLVPSDQDQTLVETQGLSFIRRAFFQFRDESLFIMSFILDTRLVDHYSVFTSFVKRYGPPSSLSPKEAVWETAETRVSIERPLTVKYIDKPAFSAMVKSSSADGSRELLNRNSFLDGF